MAIDYIAYDYEFSEPPRVTSLKNSIPLHTFSKFGEDAYFVADPKGYESVVYFVAKQFLTTNESGEITDPRLLFNKVASTMLWCTEIKLSFICSMLTSWLHRWWMR